MTSDERALLAAVLAAPADDLPRLVYADYLEGDAHPRQPERAEFIRLEIAKAATGLTACPNVEKRNRAEMPWGCGPCEFCRLEIACERFHEDPDLWRAVAGDSLDVLLGYAHTSRHPSRFTDDFPAGFPTLYTARGFVSEVTCPAAAWVAHGDAIRKLHPVERVQLTTWPEVRHHSGDVVPNPDAADVTAYLARRWPGVGFTLPPPLPRAGLEQALRGGEALARGYARRQPDPPEVP